jgi:peptidoglycan/xylan/chitin deacetylase (PgdA/CDA1 family)
LDQESFHPRAADCGADSGASVRTRRRRTRDALLGAARRIGWLRWREVRRRDAWTILTYHRVLPAEVLHGYPFPALVMPERMFEMQVAWLARHAEVLPIGEAARSIAQRRTRPLVSISFDDGYADNVESAAPMLERHGLRATFFVATEFVRANDWMWYDLAALRIRGASDAELERAARAYDVPPPRAPSAGASRAEAWVEALKTRPSAVREAFLAELPAAADEASERRRFRAMRPEQVSALAHAGHEIGSHSASHEILTHADDVRLRHEVEASRQCLRDWTGTEIAGFCYPNGTHDARVVAAVASAGYRYACTTLPPRAAPAGDPLRLGRRDLTATRVCAADGRFSSTAFRAELVGLLDGIR